MGYLNLQAVDKYYGKLHAIKGVNLSIEKGEFIVFVGPSGCGKSTLLRMIAGLERINGGTLMLDGKDITHAKPSQRDLAMVFQTYALYPHMTVAENMSFSLRLANTDKAIIDEKVKTAAEKLDLTRYLERTPKELSGGQRQRVAIGRAIVRQPKVFLFDEPLSNLDAALRGQTRVEIARLHRELGATTIYVTHDQVEAMTLADRVVVLRDGIIEQVGTPLELYDQPANRFVAQFIGMPQMNMIPAAQVSSAPQGVAELGVRTEHMAVCPTGEARMKGKVEMVESLGNETLIHVRPEYMTDEHEVPLIIRQYERTPLDMGDETGVRWDDLHVHYFDAQGQIIRDHVQGQAA